MSPRQTASHRVVQHRTALHRVAPRRTASHRVGPRRSASHLVAPCQTASHVSRLTIFHHVSPRLTTCPITRDSPRNHLDRGILRHPVTMRCHAAPLPREGRIRGIWDRNGGRTSARMFVPTCVLVRAGRDIIASNNCRTWNLARG